MTTNQMDTSTSEFNNLSIKSKPSKPSSTKPIISVTPQPQTPQKLSKLNTNNLPSNNIYSSNSPNDKPSYSQSQPNLQKITENNGNGNDNDSDTASNSISNNNNNNINDINNENGDATLTGAIYNYGTSYASSAYTYASSLIWNSPEQNNNGNNNENNNDNIQSNGTPQNHISNGSSNEHKYNTSIADNHKYPMVFTENDSINSNLTSLLNTVHSAGINTDWTKHFSEPSVDSVLLRSKTYLKDGKKHIDMSSKIFDNSPIFRLAHVQSFKTEIMIDNIAMHPLSWYNQNISLDDMSCFTLIVHLQVKSIKTSFITYHVLDYQKNKEKFIGYNKNGTPIIKNDPALTKLLDLILNCNDNQIINNRLKLIPRIVTGPYPVKRVVENRPVLLGNKVGQKYFRGSNYFEIDSRVDESMVAASIIRLCHKFAKRIVVDMAWTIQGDQENELPERLLCGCTIHNMDFSKCKDINYEMQNCQKLIYNIKNENEKKENHK